MARFNAENIEQYGSSGASGKGSYFKLSNDKDTARIRILYNKAEDIDGFSVHRVQVGDRERYVNCLRDSYNSPIDDCPFCKSKIPVQAKMFIPLYNEDTGEFQIWERGKTFYGQISGLCSRYPNIVSRTFDVERNGKPKDTSTTYAFYPVGDADGTTVEDILEDLGMDSLPNPLGTIILDKSADEMMQYIDSGNFPSNDTPVRRRDTSNDDIPRRRGNRDISSNRGDRF